jgi:hypothetical protein
MKLLTAATQLTMALFLATAPVFAQDSVADKYDTKKTVTLTGTVNRMWFAPNIPFCIVLHIKENDGKIQKWVVAGDSASALKSAGWAFGPPPMGTLNFNDKITVTAYLPKKGSKAAEELAASSPELAEVLKDARLAHGVEISLANGKKLPFGASQ